MLAEAIMRTITLLTLLAAPLFLCSGPAAAAPWCAQYGGGDKGGGTNCGFYSFEQCMAAISGNGGFCTRNQLWSIERQKLRANGNL